MLARCAALGREGCPAEEKPSAAIQREMPMLAAPRDSAGVRQPAALLEPISPASTLSTSSTGVREVPVSSRQQVELQTANPREVEVLDHARAVPMEAARSVSPAVEGPGDRLGGVGKAKVRASVQSRAGTKRRQATEVPRETEPPERLLGNDETPKASTTYDCRELWRGGRQKP